jgi:hypothetical protein
MFKWIIKAVLWAHKLLTYKEEIEKPKIPVETGRGNIIGVCSQRPPNCLDKDTSPTTVEYEVSQVVYWDIIDSTFELIKDISVVFTLKEKKAKFGTGGFSVTKKTNERGKAHVIIDRAKTGGETLVISISHEGKRSSEIFYFEVVIP